MNKEEFEYVSPNLVCIGSVMQEKFDEGFRVVDGYPLQTSWQYVVRMERSVAPVIPQPTSERAKPGRPKQKEV